MSDSAILEPIAAVGLNLEAGGGRIGLRVVALRLYDNLSPAHCGCPDGPPPVRLQRLGLPGMDRSRLSECERIEAPRLLADFRHGRDQLNVLSGALARHGAGMGALHPRRLRLRSKGPANRDPRPTARPREGR